LFDLLLLHNQLVGSFSDGIARFPNNNNNNTELLIGKRKSHLQIKTNDVIACKSKEQFLIEAKSHQAGASN